MNLVSGGGSSRVDPHHWVTPLDGIKAKLRDRVEIGYEPGYDNRANLVPVENARFMHLNGETQGLQAEFYNNLDFSGDPALTRIDPSISAWWGGAGPASGIVDEKHYSVRRSITVFAGQGCLQYQNQVRRSLLDNDIGVRSNTAFEPERMRVHKVIALEKGRGYAFRAEYVSGENNPFALIQFLYKSSMGVEGDLVERAVRLAKLSDAAIIVAGLPDLFESEGQDRSDIALPGSQEALIRAVAMVNPNTVVVVNAGAPVAMPWADDVEAILLMYYPGQEGGHALADILFGDVNPSGKLTVSFPKRLEDNPAFIHYPGWKDVHYGEGLFVGYRYYDTKDVAPLFPFGHGLSYTNFSYSEMTLPSEVMMGEDFKVSVTVENIGEGCISGISNPD